MNILITSVGRRNKLVKYFKNHFKKVIVTDASEYAPAIYEADKYYITPKIDSPNYIEVVKEICKREQVTGILSLIDPELHKLSSYKEEFSKIGVTIIGSDEEISELCFDKWKMYEFLKKNNFKTPKTYKSIETFKEDYKNKKIFFPVFIKPVTGSASIGINKIDNMSTLELTLKLSKGEMLIQEFMNGQEIGADVYIDLLNKEVISIFTKEKLSMRAGETDKAKSFKDNELFNIITNFIKLLGVIGPVDLDIFKVNDEYYISEVNPRFGGGYLIAYECGEKFPEFIKNNLENKVNSKKIGLYEENMIMLKCDDLKIIHKNKE